MKHSFSKNNLFNIQKIWFSFLFKYESEQLEKNVKRSLKMTKINLPPPLILKPLNYYGTTCM